MNWWQTLTVFGLGWLVAAVSVGRCWLGRRVIASITRSGVAELIVFSISLALGLLPRVFSPFPPPSVQDEFSYLLAADTFSHGRLTNPTHPLWRHFETFHVIFRPTYASKFPPGQGLALAIGQVMGWPAIGAFCVIAIACAAIVWAARAFVPARWAMLTGLLAAFHPLLNYWGQSYWGGGVALLGGALLVGGAARLLRMSLARRDRGAVTSGVAGAIGMSLLAMSRPFEGAIVAVVMFAIVLIICLRRGGAMSAILRGMVGALIVLITFACWLGYYNFRITGSALEMPWTLYARQYMVAPVFWWQSPKLDQHFDHPKMKQFHRDYEYQVEYLPQCTRAGFTAALKEKLADLCRQWVDAPTLAVPLLIGVPLALRRSRRRRSFVWLAVIVCLALPALNLALTPWLRMQYMAPAAASFFALIAVGLLALWRRNRPLVFAAIVTQIVVCLVSVVQFARVERPPGAARQALVDQLGGLPGKHLVAVTYSPAPQVIFEWVYNAADIDASKIVWARAEDERGLAELVDYYRDRTIWLLQVDGARVAPLRQLRGPVSQ